MKLLSATFIFRGWKFEFTRMKGKRYFRKKKGETMSHNGKFKFKVKVTHGRDQFDYKVASWAPTAAVCRRIKKHIKG